MYAAEGCCHMAVQYLALFGFGYILPHQGVMHLFYCALLMRLCICSWFAAILWFKILHLWFILHQQLSNPVGARMYPLVGRCHVAVEFLAFMVHLTSASCETLSMRSSIRSWGAAKRRFNTFICCSGGTFYVSRM